MTELKKVRKLDMGEISKELLFSLDGSASAFDNEKYIAFPGFCDVHVHFRESRDFLIKRPSSPAAPRRPGEATLRCVPCRTSLRCRTARKI